LVLAWRRKRQLEVYGLGWIAIAFLPVSNLLFSTGILIAERTLYLPSIGLALATGAALARLPGVRVRILLAASVLAGGTRSALPGISARPGACRAEPWRLGSRRLVARAHPMRRELILVFVAAVALYLPTVRYGFVQDDRAIIASNPAAHSVGAALRAFKDPYWPPESGAGLYRPVTILSFAVDWTLSGGRPGWLHLINALWHGVATVLLVILLA